MRHEITRHICDLHEDSAETEATHLGVVVSFQRRTSTLDLCDEHRQEVGSTLAHLLAQGTPSKAPAKRQKRSSVHVRAPRPTQPYEPEKVRAWAVADGREVPARGRLSNAVVNDYLAAHA